VNNNPRTIFTLVKFFRERKHLDDFLNGSLYMNPLKEFQHENRFFAKQKKIRWTSSSLKLTLKDFQYQYSEFFNTSVYDKYESTSVHWQPNQVEMKFNEIVITPNDLAGPIVIQTKAFDNFNIFCMYAINSGNFKELNDDNYEEFMNSLRIHKKNNEFGNFCVIVTNVTEFFERVKQAIIKNNFYMKANFIDYYNDEFHGSFSGIEALFHKKKQFAHQNEYRIVINNMTNNNQAYRLEIEDIRDICSISSIDEINKAEWNLKKT